MSRQDKHCSDCNKYYKREELVEGLACPECNSFSDHVWEALSAYVSQHGAIILEAGK